MTGLSSLTFPPVFFEDEVREGFFVSGMMKRCWAAQLKALSEVNRICEKHDIVWWICTGTLLGAVRHKGFIPWDDDLDICMMREDLEHFLQLAPGELTEGYSLGDVRTRDDYENPNLRVITTEIIHPDIMRRFYGFPYTAGVDIFALDGIFPEEVREQQKREEFAELVQIFSKIKTTPQEKQLIEEDLRRIEEKHRITFNRRGNLCNQLMRVLIKVLQQCPVAEAKEIEMYLEPKDDFRLRKEWFSDTVKLPFEHLMLPACSGYAEMLRTVYKNVSFQKMGGAYHDYPYYQKFEDDQKKAIGHHVLRYTFTEDEFREMCACRKRTITNQRSEDVGKQREIVFLPARKEWWNTMAPVYELALSEPDAKVIVLPVSWHRKDMDGNPYDEHNEAEELSGLVTVTSGEEYDITACRPAVIVTQFPYDETNRDVEIDERYFSKNLVNYAEKVIYVPCYDVETPEKGDEISRKALSVLIEQPAVVYADLVLLPTKGLREIYIETLSDIAGEETRAIWEKKIQTTDTPDLNVLRSLFRTETE